MGRTGTAPAHDEIDAPALLAEARMLASRIVTIVEVLERDLDITPDD